MSALYHSSRGPIEIEKMATPHMKSALAKLEREEPDRTEEINALTAAVEQREREWRAANPEEGEP